MAKIKEGKKKEVKVGKAEIVKTGDNGKGAEVEVLGADPFEETAKEMKHLKEDKAIPLAKTLLDGIEANFFRLGGTLSTINTNSWFEKAGYDNFHAFVEAELGLKYRKAMYLIQIYDNLVEAGIPYEKVKSVGWTKLKELAPIMNKGNVTALVKKAGKMNTLQLQEEVKLLMQKSKGSEDVPASDEVESKPVSTKTFKLHTDQKETIIEALDKAKGIVPTEYESVALEMICMDYLAGGEKPTKEKPAKAKSAATTKEDVQEFLHSLGVQEALALVEEIFEEEGLKLSAQIDEEG